MTREWDEFEHRRVLGRGNDVFDRAADALIGWRLHEAAGLMVTADGPAHLGTRAVLTLAAGPLQFRAPVQVNEVIDTPAARGFTYVALAGHPEEGWETFLVERSDDVVTFTVRARSRPRTWWARAGAPLTRWVQRLVTERYLTAAQAIAG